MKVVMPGQLRGASDSSIEPTELVNW